MARSATHAIRRISADPRASARARDASAHAIVHTQHHSMTMHKHDSSTILHTAADIPTRQRLERAARAALGTAPTLATLFGASGRASRQVSAAIFLFTEVFSIGTI